MITSLLIIFLVCGELVLTIAENRVRPQCTLSIFRNTTSLEEFEFYSHVERFFQKHEIGTDISSFLDKGDLTIAIR